MGLTTVAGEKWMNTDPQWLEPREALAMLRANASLHGIREKPWWEPEPERFGTWGAVLRAPEFMTVISGKVE
jgi:hypothetical protein